MQTPRGARGVAVGGLLDRPSLRGLWPHFSRRRLPTQVVNLPRYGLRDGRPPDRFGPS